MKHEVLPNADLKICPRATSGASISDIGSIQEFTCVACGLSSGVSQMSPLLGLCLIKVLDEVDKAR